MIELLSRPIYRLGLLMGLQAGTTDTAMAIEVVNGAACVTDPARTRKMVDTGTYTYIGYAVPGAATSAAYWQVQRITNASGDRLFAAAGAFSQIWDNYASLTYAV